MSESALARIRVVLHETQDLVNVAAVVRAMKNMGLSDLRLVNAVALDAWRVQGIAHDTADVLERTREQATLSEAIGDCVLVAAFTARHRAARWAIATPREVTPRLLEATQDGPVALLFGREDRGLPNDALDRAHVHVSIPTTAYASLNLAQAVMVALYELHVAAGDATRARDRPRGTDSATGTLHGPAASPARARLPDSVAPSRPRADGAAPGARGARCLVARPVRRVEVRGLEPGPFLRPGRRGRRPLARWIRRGDPPPSRDRERASPVTALAHGFAPIARSRIIDSVADSSTFKCEPTCLGRRRAVYAEPQLG